MGIRGLTGFIDQNQSLLQHNELHDCAVVIDGNNFYHYLYHACHVQCHFGGDYDVYRKKVVSTFQSIRQCGITPYIVLDGAYTIDSRKLHTSLSRAVARIRLIDSLANGHRGQALPVLAYETFLQVLSEMKIPYVMCQFEADSEIATLANKLKCPVISNDSDFYIFDLDFGFLPLDYLDFRPLQKQCPDSGRNYSFLHCYKYHVDDLINSFDGLNRATLPFLAILLGNDFIEASAFSAFYVRVKVPKLVSKKFSLPPKMTRVISVLHWLGSKAEEGDITSMKEQLLSYVPHRKRDRVEKLFDQIVQGYTEVHMFEGWDLFSYFCQDTEFPSGEVGDFLSYDKKVFPRWFMKLACQGELTPHILNAAVLHRIILLTQVESLALSSSFNSSASLRNILYSILLKDDIMQSAVADEERKSREEENPTSLVRDGCVEEYTRIGKQLKKSRVKVCVNTVPGLQELSDFSVEQKCTLLYKAFQLEPHTVNCFSENLKIFALCFISWVRCCEPKVTSSQFDSLLLCVLYLAASREIKAKKREQGLPPSPQPKFDIPSVCSQCSRDSLKAFTSKLDKYHKEVPTFNRGRCFQPSLCHVFAQLQATVADACHLNRLLGQPLSTPQPAELLNGSLLYNLTSDLSSRPRPDLFVALMFGEEASPLKDVYLEMRCFLLEKLELGKLLGSAAQPRHRRSKVKKRKEKKVSPEHEESDTEAHDCNNEFGEFASSNKFSVLNLCD